ncbi:gas vesicle protein GvpG [Krasilnikoviella flava]|uniref:Gas vesicle protein G n=1 Tax=Krasilnikoviella flava TaxID=526729 RepID=A0A1T5L7Z5_9MICO|nr:gas vesicle protein GvpG [Krasilnikoviella flava]SKC72101.1 Gas vesicle protein G [Krasilnikoviella flava]
MGLLSSIVLLPLAPVRGVAWVAEQVRSEAEREWYDPGTIRKQLDEVARAREEESISASEAEAVERELVARLLESSRRRRGGVR